LRRLYETDTEQSSHVISAAVVSLYCNSFLYLAENFLLKLH